MIKIFETCQTNLRNLSLRKIKAKNVAAWTYLETETEFPLEKDFIKEVAHIMKDRGGLNVERICIDERMNEKSEGSPFHF